MIHKSVAVSAVSKRAGDSYSTDRIEAVGIGAPFLAGDGIEIYGAETPTLSGGFVLEDAQGVQLAQLDAVKRGDLEDWELISAKKTLLSAYRSMGDSQGKLENFYLGQVATGLHETPEELAQQVRDVTPERIFRAMQTVKLDTVYFLQGKETAE